MTLLSLTQIEAAERSRLLEVQRYDIEVDMTGLLEGELFASVSTITFSCSEPGTSTFVDCVADISRATLNGTDLDLGTAAGGRLPLPGLAADNVLVVEASTTNTGSGEGILRTVDPTDGLVYVWTSLETDEARRLWACFDQPDLKAPHKFTVLAPASWTVTSNSGPDLVEDAEQADARVWHFGDTPRLSTYVVVVNAGPFHEIRQQHDGYDLGFFCRQSLVAHLERDVEELVTLTRQGLAFFGDKFGIAFPQSRYDQVFVPNLGGAMENWGCVTYGDSQLFRTPPSHNQRAVRAEFVLHEMAHMWFGDLVTMQWWDDLWLNEAFASWASNWAMSQATEFSDQWASFLALYKRPAYEMDMGPGRHPIRGAVADVNGAMANFDSITYVKGQSVLHQLMAYIGEDAFVEGLRAYFRKHAFANTVLDDLMGAYGEAAGRDLSSWTASWLDRAGTDVLALDGSTVRAESPDDQAPRPHRINIATYAVAGDELRQVAVTSTELTRESTEVDLPTGDLHLLNAEDLTFAAVRPDAESLRLMLDHLGDFPEPLSRALVVGTITQLLLLGELAPGAGAAAIARGLHSEHNPALVEPFLSVGHHVADRWARPDESPALRSALADAALVLSEDPVNRQPALRTLAANATTDQHWAALDEAAAESADSDLAWRMMIRRSELGQRDDDAVARLLEQDADPDAGIKRLKVLAASPDEESKEAVWRAFFVDYAVPASRDTLELGAIFWRPAQAELLAPYTHRYLAELPDLKGGMLNQGVVIRAMYPHAVGDESFLAAALAATEDESISLYARNQLRAQSFVLGRLHQARTIR
ncbi:aminopeptidase N [Nocardioides sp. CF8]|uniref:aminopeptidase N n=1 Tax=Nocardioides sp. CF8 TaxID=110319 RepID=UPI0003313D3F|nr:aminopeptidase N [Nocardioides sp. CF8]EON23950.1 aminopeptidase N [Nocardioides sp. CF8]